VAEDVDELILGYDSLRLQGVNQHRQLALHGVTVPLTNRAAKFSLCRVYIQQLVSIPPHMEQNVPVKVAHNSLYTPIADWMINPIKLSENVAARVLIPRDESIAGVRKINMTEECVMIPAGTELGGAEIAHIVEPGEDCTSSWSTSTTGPEFERIQSVIDSLPGELNVIERLEAIELLHRYQDVFSKNEYDLGRTPLTEHHIDAGDARPIKQGLRRQPQTILPVIDTFTENMERQNIIEKSESPWASTVVVVTQRHHVWTCWHTKDHFGLSSAQQCHLQRQLPASQHSRLSGRVQRFIVV